MKLEELLTKCRMGGSSDQIADGKRINKLFGLKNLIEENLSPESVVCEIGSYMGVSGELFAILCKQVYCIDTFHDPNYDTIFDEMMKQHLNVSKVKGLSEDVFKIFADEAFDFVYIDADHRYSPVKQDITNWKNKVKKDGFLGGHDYHTSEPGVIQAVNEEFPNGIKLYEDSSWIIKRTW